MIPLLRQGRGAWTTGALMLLGAGAVGCGPAGDGPLPPNIPDPASLKTPAGAVARYQSVLAMLGGMLSRIVVTVGVMTDELAVPPTPLGVTGTAYTQVDARADFSAVSEGNWNRLHVLRAQAREARGFLAAYAPDSSPALQGELHALEGYADLYLADLFCSGIPLSTLNFDGSFTLQPGSTTAEVYERARGLFDSALVQAGDRQKVLHLAALGKGRALLALGQYAAAAEAVAAVSDGYAYYTPSFPHPSSFAIQENPDDSLALWAFAGHFTATPTPSVADNEGQNGLDYRSSHDPRSSFTPLDGTDPRGNPMYFPTKYMMDYGIPGLPRQLSASDTFLVANGIEARLIEAEAALRAGDPTTWLAKLNHLRQTEAVWKSIAAESTAPDPWVPGPLPELTDPETDSARVSLLFRERAMWLFMTGRRQGDLRRLIRQYPGPGHTSTEVYPSGGYFGGGGRLRYGNELVIPVPESERQLNTKYTGCLDREP